MEIVTQLITYFGLDLISDAETFPELLQAFFCSLFALYLVVFTMRAMFAATYKIRQSMEGRRR